MSTSGYSLSDGATFEVRPRGDYEWFTVEAEMALVVMQGNPDNACVIEGTRERMAAVLRQALDQVGEGRFVLQYRDAADLHRWSALSSFERVGDALAALDDELEDEPEGLPKGRHRVVDMESGTVVEWGQESIRS